MISGGCILYSGCDETREAGSTGATFSKNFELTTNPQSEEIINSADAISCKNRCYAGLERTNSDWCSCSSECAENIVSLDCCSDFETECSVTTTQVTTLLEPSWGDWGDCTEICGGGKTFRTCSTGTETDCSGAAFQTCNTNPCTTELTSTTTLEAKITCVGRCGDDVDDNRPGDCICTDICTSDFLPEECCDDYYTRCIEDHSSGSDLLNGDDEDYELVDPNIGIDTGMVFTTYSVSGNEEDDDDDLVIIVAIAVGGVVLIVIIILVLRHSCRPKPGRKYHHQKRLPETMLTSVELQPTAHYPSQSGRSENFVTI
jgi:hypothetical protein